MASLYVYIPSVMKEVAWRNVCCHLTFASCLELSLLVSSVRLPVTKGTFTPKENTRRDLSIFGPLDRETCSNLTKALALDMFDLKWDLKAIYRSQTVTFYSVVNLHKHR